MAQTTPPPPPAKSGPGNTKDWPIEVRALLTAMQRPAPKARHPRRKPRQPFLFEATLRFDDPTRGGPQQLTVHTRDRNNSCIAFITDVHVKSGQLVELDLTGSPATADLGRISGRVRRCRQFRQGWFDCVMQVGQTARQPRSLWSRAFHWLGETTGFGPDDRRGHPPSRGGRAA